MTPPSRTSRCRRLIPVVIALVWSAGAASPALAAEPGTPSPTAEQLAEQAYEQHAAGREAEAIATYLRAYELSKAGAILFNVATIYDRKLRERGLAEDYYRRYLSSPDAEPDLVKKANERLTALKQEEDDAVAAAKRPAVAVVPVPAPPAAPPPAPAPAPAQTTAPAPPEPPAAAPEKAASAGGTSGETPTSGHALRVAGVAVGAVGVAGVAASLVLGLVAKGKNDSANAVCNGAACTSEDGVNLASQAGTFATASTATFVGGLALVGGGVAMYLLAPKAAPTSVLASLAVSPRLGPSQVGLSLGGSF